MNKTVKIVLIASSVMIVGGTLWFIYAQDHRRKKINAITVSPMQASDILREIQNQ